MSKNINTGDTVKIIEDVKIFGNNMKGSLFEVINSTSGGTLYCKKLKDGDDMIFLHEDEVIKVDTDSFNPEKDYPVEIGYSVLQAIYQILLKNEECHKNRDRMNAFYHLSDEVKLSEITQMTQSARIKVENILKEKKDEES